MKLSHFLQRLTGPTVIWTALVLAAPAAAAQDIVEPVIIVNEKAITQFELDQRALMLAAFGARGGVRALAREQLIDDRLMIGAAERVEISLTEEQLEAGLRDYAERRELDPAQLVAALEARGVAESTLRDFIRAGLTWRATVQALFSARANPSEQDLDAALEFAERGVQLSVLLQEIALPFEVYGEDEAQQLARRLSRELNRGGSFGAAVSRYSRSASAARGGRLDWLPAGRLPPELAGQVLALQPGEVSAPVPITGGVAVLKLLDTREEPRPPEEVADDTITYSQLILPLAAGSSEAAASSARSQAVAIRRETRLCIDLDRRAADFGVGSGRSEPTPMPQVPADLAATLATMDPGDIEIIRDSRGVVLLMLCGRSGEVSPEDREALRRRLLNQRLNALAQGYLQELRGDAVIVER